MEPSLLPSVHAFRPRNRGRRLPAAAAALATLVVLAAGCGRGTKTSSSSTTSVPGASASSTPKGSGPVSVLYAASLEPVLAKQVAPAFQQATGYTFQGEPGDSGSLANAIKGKVQQADVFVSAAAAKDQVLEGPANGDLVSWYASFASSSLVLGYNPHSKFAADLKSKPWWQVLTEPGILVGRTDPATDPKGALAVQALDGAAAQHHAPGLKDIVASTSNVFPEQTLVGRLQAGQLDVGFFYLAEARPANIPTLPLTGQDLQATYTVTVPANAPHPPAAAAFVRYLLGPDAKGPLHQDGFTRLSPPQVSGTGVPGPLQAVLSGT
jgi:molybdate/tungstate transport system substrate-binding protein